MKSTRFAKIIAVVLVITMLPLWLFGCGEKLANGTVSALTEMMVGNGKLSTKDETSATYLENLDAEVKNLVTYYANGAWAASNITNGDTTRAAHYKNIYKLALGWGTKGSAYYHDSSVLDKIKTALELGYTSYFGGDTYAEYQECSLYLVKTLLIIDGKLKSTTVEDYLFKVQIKIPAPSGDGMDLLRTAYIAIATSALLGEENNLSKFSTTFLEDNITLVSSGNGLYEDGSYIWKTSVNTLEDGVEAASIIADLYYAYSGTSCDLGTIATDALYNWVISSMQYSLYNGTAMTGSLNYSISEADRISGEAIGTMLKIASLCSEEQAATINSLVKAYGENGDGEFVKYIGSYGAELLAKVMKNDKITAADTTFGAHSYAAADTLTVLGSKFSLSLSMSSYRTNKYESAEYASDLTAEELGAYNGELWFIRDGMLTLYTKDYKLPSNYWSNVNTYHLPGTTVDNRDRNDTYSVTYNGITNYAGSAVLGETAVSAMIATGNNNEYLSNLSAKKSWFIFGDKIVCLGADINSSTTPAKVKDGYAIETVIENIYYSNFDEVYLNENDTTKASDREAEVTLGSALYVSKYGGIYIPESEYNANSTVYMLLNKTTGGNYLELWFDHGVTPEGATYEYVIYPSTTSKLISFYEKVAQEDYTVLANDSSVQAVKDNTSGQIGYVFWQEAECNGVSTNFACVMMVSETDSKITIAISDFSHNAFDNQGSTITLSGNYTLSSASDGLSFSGNTITVDREVAADGQTLVIVLSK